VSRVDGKQQARSIELVRRLSDLIIVAVLVVVTFPLMGIVALAIKSDNPGPVFLWHERIDPHGRRFYALKFRTTVVHPAPSGAESQLTFVGGLIWYLRIENLPQLLNVLRGEIRCIDRGADQLFFLD
jgi:lipopolysaccharide/colanic/teichoic acid biosynthesis glycosyltransferase